MAEQSPTHVHREVVRDAGFSSLSVISVIAGTLTAYGTFAIVAAVVGASLRGSGVSTEFRTNDWTGSGAVALLASAATLLIAYLFGGYVAGRMARRAAILHGIAVFVLSLLAGAVVGGVVGLVSDNQALKSNLRSIGVPTTADQVTGVAIVGAAVSLAAILIGSLLGAMLGERWHTKLDRRAVDPAYGPNAEARAQAEREQEDARNRAARAEEDRRRAEEDRQQGLARQAEVRNEVRSPDDEAVTSDDHTAVARSTDETGLGDVDHTDRADLRNQGDQGGQPAAVPLNASGGSDDDVRYTAEEWRRMESQGSTETGPRRAR
ncbi:MAG: hypothetical protein ACR2MB_02960 [Acidimicrobiales bacterium]